MGAQSSAVNSHNPLFDEGLKQGIRQGYTQGKIAGAKEGFAKGSAVGFKHGVAHGIHVKVATLTCYGFLGGSLATLAAVFSIGYLGRRSYDFARDRAERVRLTHFREALGVDRCDSLLLYPDFEASCYLEELLQTLEETTGISARAIVAKLKQIIEAYSMEIRKWQVFQVFAREIMEDPLNADLWRQKSQVTLSARSPLIQLVSICETSN